MISKCFVFYSSPIKKTPITQDPAHFLNTFNFIADLQTSLIVETGLSEVFELKTIWQNQRDSQKEQQRKRH